MERQSLAIKDIYAEHAEKPVENYTYLAYKEEVYQNIIQLTKEGLSIRSTARILKISTTALLKRIVFIARNITKPIISKGKTYEVDELCTYIKTQEKLYLAGFRSGKEF
jgi:hypothetical protein